MLRAETSIIFVVYFVQPEKDTVISVVYLLNPKSVQSLPMCMLKVQLLLITVDKYLLALSEIRESKSIEVH